MASVPTSGSAPPPPVWDARPAGRTSSAYAGFWIRVVACIVDVIALAILWQVVSLFFPPAATAGERRGGRALAVLAGQPAARQDVRQHIDQLGLFRPLRKAPGAGHRRQVALGMRVVDQQTARG